MRRPTCSSPADLDWMDYVQGKNLIKTDTRFNLLGNKIVHHRAQGLQDHDAHHQGRPTSPRRWPAAGSRWPTSTPCPAGKYGKAALEKLGAWSAVKDSIAQAENVRAALPAGRPAARRRSASSTAPTRPPSPNVKIVATFPEDSHPPIIYPAALDQDSNNADAKAFLDFLRSAKARTAFEKQGFTVLVKSNSST